MPGYKGHLAGGCVAFGITVALLVTYYPTVFKEHSYSLFSLFPSLLAGTHETIKTTFPPVIRASRNAVDSCSPWALVVLEWFLFALAGCLFPDIDIKSKGQKWIYWCLLFVLIALIGKQRMDLVAFISVLSLTPMLVKHRGLFHRLWFVILAPLLVWFLVGVSFPFIKKYLLIDTVFFIAGAISHLWLDLGFKRMLRW